MKYKYRIMSALAVCLIAMENVGAAEINDKLEISGVLEVEASYHDDGAGESSSSDLAVATGELGISGTVNDWVSGSLLYLFEGGGDGDDTFEVDEAAINIANKDRSPFYLNVGRIYMPFGNYESVFVNDPLTLDVGETRKTALKVGMQKGAVDGSVCVFKNLAGNGNSNLNGFGAKLTLTKEFGNNSIVLGASYINSIADSGGLSGAIEDKGTDLSTLEKTDGVGVNLLATIGKFTVIGEYVAAQDDVLGGATNTNYKRLPR